MFRFATGTRWILSIMAVSTLLAAACAPSAPPTPAPAAKAPPAAQPTAQPAAAKPAPPAPLATAPAAPKPAATAAPAAKPPAAAGPVQRGGVVRVGMVNEISTLDPHMGILVAERHIQRMISGTLFDLDDKLSIIPGLAQSFDTTADGLAITIKLRPGIKFHDGTDFNAEAVKFNLDRILDPATKSPRSTDIATVKSVDVVDPLTVKLNLKQPDASLLVQFTDRVGMVLSPTAVKQLGKDIGRKAVGAGPFKFHEWVVDDHLTLKRNENYWQKDANGQPLPYLDEVIYRPIPDANVRVANLRSGTVDIIGEVAGNQLAPLRSDQNLRVLMGSSLAFEGIWFPTKTPPFDKKEVRQALSYSIDRSAIVRSVVFGAGAEAAGPIPPTLWAADPNVKPFPRDINKAKELLQKAGTPTVNVKMIVPNRSPRPAVAQVVKEQAAAAGFNIDLEIQDNALVLERARKKDFQLLYSGFSGRPDPDGNIRAFFHSKGGTNYSTYESTKADELIMKALTTSKIEERKAMYGELTKLLVDDQPVMFIYHRTDPVALRAVLQDYQDIPDGIMRFERVWLKR